MSARVPVREPSHPGHLPNLNNQYDLVDQPIVRSDAQRVARDQQLVSVQNAPGRSGFSANYPEDVDSLSDDESLDDS
ncbi:hypothetical protein K449DRAFT_383647 [Hypoxylon sp. EC38]|nr:hypothetical protein K449DRAFT_383647 [Hypoxylon sp. EC38]